MSADIVKRRLFLIDIDPVRSGTVSATDDEQMASRQTVKRILRWLLEKVSPPPVIVDIVCGMASIRSWGYRGVNISRDGSNLNYRPPNQWLNDRVAFTAAIGNDYAANSGRYK